MKSLEILDSHLTIQIIIIFAQQDVYLNYI